MRSLRNLAMGPPLVEWKIYWRGEGQKSAKSRVESRECIGLILNDAGSGRKRKLDWTRRLLADSQKSSELKEGRW